MPDAPKGLAQAPEIDLGVLLFIPYRHMEQRILAVVVEAGHPITLAQARIFQRIDHHGSRLTSLAESAQLTKQAAGFLVDQLERAGYVERAPDPGDGRARLIAITRRGYDVIAVAAAEQARIEAEWAAHLGPRATSGLRQALERLREITDPFR
ncbi:MAG TPA: MarR family transcriptional regulator [Propionibacteriaceae bacterium]|nr:MarR family transcriptional regulator [Propionibacteriaceae bacterium]